MQNLFPLTKFGKSRNARKYIDHCKCNANQQKQSFGNQVANSLPTLFKNVANTSNTNTVIL